MKKKEKEGEKIIEQNCIVIFKNFSFKFTKYNLILEKGFVEGLVISIVEISAKSLLIIVICSLVTNFKRYFWKF